MMVIAQGIEALFHYSFALFGTNTIHSNDQNISSIVFRFSCPSSFSSLSNFVHWKAADHVVPDPIYPIVNPPNLTPCIDGAGEIFSVGPESNWKVGDRVMINPTFLDRR
jgi:hypothetical protein